MCITNKIKAEISYRHKDKIQGLFKKYVDGDLEINHFSLNIFFGNGQNIFLSSTPDMAKTLCEHDFVTRDSNYKPEIYQKTNLYPWKSVQRHRTDKIINFIKEEKFQMRSGVMIVRNMGAGRYVMYSVATHRKDNPDFPGQFYFLYTCKSHYIAQIGDYMYENLLPTINDYGYKVGVEMPKLLKNKEVVLEPNFFTNEQKDIFHDINNSFDAVNIIEKIKNPVFRVICGGKMSS